MPCKSNSSAAWGMSQSFKVMCSLRRPLSWQKQNWTAMQQHRRTNVVFLNDWLCSVTGAQVYSVRQMTWHVSSFIRGEQFGRPVDPGTPFKVVFHRVVSVKQSIGQSQCRQFLWGSRTFCQDCFRSWRAAASWQRLGGGDSGQARLL